MGDEINSDINCRLCKQTFSPRKITNHLKSCKEYHSQGGVKDVFLIKAGVDHFWVYFELETKLTLEDLAQFFRDLWVECCGHLSAFTIERVPYTSSKHSPDEKSMNIPLNKVIQPKSKFSYEYDFGSTTMIYVECISLKKGNEGIHIIARNNLPEIKCNKCGSIAEEICSQCIDEGLGFLCKGCAKKHECGIDILLPVVNSPRLGICGFTGYDCPLIDK